jgi:glycosyltransferase involved in cell wall biosynthesis
MEAYFAYNERSEKIVLGLTVVIFTKNEESNIRECIDSVKDFSPVLVIDSNSSDSTREIAHSLGASVIEFEWNRQYPKKRQWTLNQFSDGNSWILFLDADERMSMTLQQELEIFLTGDNDAFAGGLIELDYYFAGKRLRFGQRPKKLVLLRVGSVSYPIIDDLNSEGMGELEGHYQPKVNGKTRKFKSRIVHNDKDPISTWMTRHVNYAKWEAHLMQNLVEKYRVDSSKGMVASAAHRLPARPLLFFIYSYVLKFGFLDGKAGFDYAFAKSWYYWLSAVIAREKKQSER